MQVARHDRVGALRRRDRQRDRAGRTISPPIARRRPHSALAVVALTVTGLITVFAPAAQAYPGAVLPRSDDVVTADSLPTVQVNGVVWSSTIVGNTVYAGGGFNQARPAGAAAGSNQTARNNFLSFNLSTGNLNTAFNPNVDGEVKVVTKSPDGSRVYIGGDFLNAAGQSRPHIAAYDTATGQLVASFRANVGSRVKAIVATNSVVYIGGEFTSIGTATRNRLAALDANTGAVLGWNPSADYTVNAMVLTPDGSRLVVGGAFQNIGGQAAYGLTAINPGTGALISWQAAATIQNAGKNSAILGLTTDGTYVYGNGYVFGAGGNFEGTFQASANSGAIRWMEDCHGDTYANFPIGNIVYTVSHAHYCGNMGGYPESVPRGTYMRHALAFTKDPTGTINPDPHDYPSWAGQPSPSLINWYPDMDNGTYTGQNQAAWTVTANAQYVVLGGEFPTVNGAGQQGLVRFGVKAVAPSRQGPQVTGGKFVPSLNSFSPGTVRVAFPANWDRDDTTLHYSVVRNSNTGAPVYQTDVSSTFWNRPNISFTDTGLTPGETYRYRLYVRDPAGNQVAGDTVTIVPGSTGSVSSYATTVLSQGASIYWRLGESSGGTAVDWAGASNGIVGSGVTRGTAGAIAGDPNPASSFNGTAAARVSTPTPAPSPATYTASAWFRTTTASGGKIVGYGDQQTAGSVNYDRQVYLDNAGRLVFGLDPRTNVTIVSPGTYRDGQWHQVVSTLGANGMRLFVDGAQVASRTDIVSGADIFGYWRVGGDTLGAAWSNRPSSAYFNGAIDDVSIYPTVLSNAQIAAQWAVGRGAGGNEAPIASFTSTSTALTANFNGSASSDPDGTIAGYAWNFGDGTTGTGSSPSHPYPATGTYSVTLTVTDNGGATNSITKQVAVSAPGNQAPTASFTASVSSRDVTVDGTGSSDPDGSIAAYAWNFGDQATATGSNTAHTYLTNGTYTVTLTVTDNNGAANTTTRQVTVSGGTPVVTAADAFARTVSNGWGTADTGGPWTANGTASLFSVNGSVGRIQMASPGAGPSMFLNSVSAADLAGTIDVALDKLPTGSGITTSVIVRRAASADYRAKLKFMPTSTNVQITRVVNGTETTLASTTVAGLSYVLGDTVRLNFQVTGNGPSTLTAKAWKVGAAVPAGWQVTATDSTGALQAAGSMGLQAYVSTSVTNTPVVASFDNLNITPPVL